MNLAIEQVSGGGDDAAARMAKAMTLQIPIRSLVAMSVGVFTPDMAEALLDILNGGSLPSGLGRLAKGLAASMKNIRHLLSVL